MANDAVISTRVDKSYLDKVDAFCSGRKRASVVVEALDRYMTACAGCLETFTLIAERDFALAEVEKLKAKPPKVDKIPSHKASRPFVNLNIHQKARMQVLRHPENRLANHGATSSELAHSTGQMTGNVAKRLQELATEGYAEPNGYRESVDSKKRLTVWVRTSKQFKGEQ